MAQVSYEAKSALEHIQRMVNALGVEVQSLHGTVGAVGTRIEVVESGLAQMSAQLGQFVTEQRRANVLSQARQHIDTLQGQLHYEFGRFDTVRDSAVGLLHALDTGLVRDETMRTIGEEQLVTVARYWLAPAVAGLAAWIRDDREQCGRALAVAYERAPARTSLLLALVLRRQDRGDAAARWLEHYLAAQDPAALTREFAVVLEAAAMGAFGPDGIAAVQRHTRQWRTQLLTDETTTREQVDEWRRELSQHASSSVSARFPHLSQRSPEWKALATALSHAEAHASFVATFRALLDTQGTVESVRRLEDQVDDLLDLLVSEYDPEEEPLRRELAYYQAVVDHDGDVDAAQTASTRRQRALDTTRDYLSIETQAAMHPALVGVSPATQRVALGACREWIAQAHAEFTAEYRAEVPASVHVAVDRHFDAVAEKIRLRRWHGSLRQPLPALEHSLASHWDDACERYVEQFHYDAGSDRLILIAGLVVALLGVGMCLGAATGSAGAVVLGLAAATVWGIAWGMKMYRAQTQAESAKRAARREVAASAERSIQSLRTAAAEYTDWRTAYAEADGQADAATAMLDELASLGTTSSIEHRTLEHPETVGDDEGRAEQ